MTSPLSQAGRVRVARVVVLVCASLAVAVSPGRTLLEAVTLVAGCLVANIALLMVSSSAGWRYDVVAPLADVAACCGIVALTGGSESALRSVFVAPAAFSAWAGSQRGAAAVAVIATIGLAVVAPPIDGAVSAASFVVTVGVLASVAGVGVLVARSREATRPDVASLGDLVALGGRDSLATLQQLAVALGSLLRCRLSLPFPYDPDRRELRLHGAPLTLGGVDSADVEAAAALAGSPLVDSAVVARRPIAWRSGIEDHRVPESARRGLRARGLMVVPVHLRNQLIGVVVTVDRAGGGTFGDDDLALAELAVTAIAARDLASRPSPLHSIVAALPEPAVWVDVQGSVTARNEPARQVFDRVDGLEAHVLNAAAQAVEARVPVEQSLGGWWVHAMPLGDDAGDGALVRISADAARDGDGSDLRRFVTGVNDAIDAPLRGIATYARAVVRDPAAATTPRFAESLLLQTEALRRAVDELLACSLAGMGPNDLRLERRDLARVVRDRVERARDTSPSVAITLQADAPIPAAVDEAILGRALDALLASAMALSPSAVRVTVHPAVDRAVVSVELSRALPPRMRRSLLEPFRLSREGGGLGIGVILAKQVAQAHGGDLAVDDDGRTLRVRLPYPPATA